jgi:hypothetical protein
MAIDSYFKGERLGQGPSGDLETMKAGSDQEMSQFKSISGSEDHFGVCSCVMNRLRWTIGYTP